MLTGKSILWTDLWKVRLRSRNLFLEKDSPRPILRLLSCGFHHCGKLCHGGDCGSCSAVCGKPRKIWFVNSFELWFSMLNYSLLAYQPTTSAQCPVMLRQLVRKSNLAVLRYTSLALVVAFAIRFNADVRRRTQQAEKAHSSFNALTNVKSRNVMLD